jgi:FixJ family two-component response regulator
LRPAADLHPPEVVKRVKTLTERERMVLESVLVGDTTREIGELLDLSHRTVELHRRMVLRKIGARNTAHLVRVVTLAGF